MRFLPAPCRRGLLIPPAITRQPYLALAQLRSSVVIFPISSRPIHHSAPLRRGPESKAGRRVPRTSSRSKNKDKPQKTWLDHAVHDLRKLFPHRNITRQYVLDGVQPDVLVSPPPDPDGAQKRSDMDRDEDGDKADDGPRIDSGSKVQAQRVASDEARQRSAVDRDEDGSKDDGRDDAAPRIASADDTRQRSAVYRAEDDVVARITSDAARQQRSVVYREEDDDVASRIASSEGARQRSVVYRDEDDAVASIDSDSAWQRSDVYRDEDDDRPRIDSGRPRTASDDARQRSVVYRDGEDDKASDRPRIPSSSGARQQRSVVYRDEDDDIAPRVISDHARQRSVVYRDKEDDDIPRTGSACIIRPPPPRKKAHGSDKLRVPPRYSLLDGGGGGRARAPGAIARLTSGENFPSSSSPTAQQQEQGEGEKEPPPSDALMSFYDNVAPARKWRGPAEDEGLPDYGREAGYPDYGKEAGYPDYGKEARGAEVGTGAAVTDVGEEAGTVEEWKGIRETVKQIEFEDRRERKLQQKLATLEWKLDEMLRRLDGKTRKGEMGEEDDRTIFRTINPAMDWRATQTGGRTMPREMSRTIPPEMMWAMPREVGRMREWTMDQAMDQAMDRRAHQTRDRTMPREMERAVDWGMDRETDRDMDQPRNQTMDLLMDRVRDRIRGLMMDQTVNRKTDLASEWEQELERRREEFEGVAISNRQLRRQRAEERRLQKEEEAALSLERRQKRKELRRQKVEELRRQKKEKAALSSERRRMAKELRRQKVEDSSPSSETRQTAEDVFSVSSGSRERRERSDDTPAKEDAQTGGNSAPWDALEKAAMNERHASYPSIDAQVATIHMLEGQKAHEEIWRLVGLKRQEIKQQRAASGQKVQGRVKELEIAQWIQKHNLQDPKYEHRAAHRRRREQLVERQKLRLQKKFGVPEGSTEPNAQVDAALEDWCLKRDTQAVLREAKVKGRKAKKAVPYAARMKRKLGKAWKRGMSDGEDQED
ncbi:hypothetical protein C8A01DRAFT_40814 [Parachaetomium inaequale]|uniref:Uncharacterized protein n=1 Tax=Parachaetomium inaequale TaxID=2588326 RepID=A0AAN6SLF5_9PEZI|nr:hypothetical protein C8A01DRAFT_40814 [Parachaetomium inaequale]